MIKQLFLFAITAMSCISTAEALPSRVLIIRHGEAAEHSNGLSLRGKTRAAALVPYILETDYLQDFGHPVALIAHQPNQVEPSRRPIETLQPLAKDLGLSINSMFTHDKWESMVDYVKNNPAFEGKTVLICWGQKNMSLIAERFGVSPRPLPWPTETYDRIWIIDFLPGGKENIRNYPMRLIYGDSLL